MLKSIKGYEGLYSIDEDGNVWGKTQKHFLKWSGKRYPLICLCKQNKKRTFSVHKLVASIYLSPPPLNTEINHKDGNKWNCNKSNLEWLTRSENALHAFHVIHTRHSPRIGSKGETNPAAKLTDQKVVYVRQLFQNGLTFSEIGRRMNLEKSTIRLVCRGKTWKHVPMPNSITVKSK